jgi:hypothetical protein
MSILWRLMIVGIPLCGAASSGLSLTRRVDNRGWEKNADQRRCNDTSAACLSRPQTVTCQALTGAPGRLPGFPSVGNSLSSQRG